MSDAGGPEAPARGEALRYWWRLGWTSFGGPAGQIALMHRDLVERRRWIDEPSFLRGLNFCTLLPGPEAQQLAIYVGWRLHGTAGGIAAGALFVLPSIAILLALSAAYVVWGHLPAVVAALSGIQAAVVAIVAEAIVRIGRRTLARPAALLIAAAAFLALRALGLPFPAIVAAALAAGALLRRALVRPGGAPPAAPAAASRATALGRLVGAGLALWGLGLAVALAAGATARQVYLFFTQAAFVTFGGAYAVLAYVGEVAVDRRGWLTAQQMIDGLAFAETTPGPLIMVLQWVGFLAGWTSQAGGAAWGSALLCALLATWATFLPGFLFVLAGAPAVERLAASPRLAGALAGVTAAAVGMILDLALRLGGAVLLAGGELDGSALAIALAAGAALLSGRVSLPALVGAAALAGLLARSF